MTQCVSFLGDVLLQKRLHYYVPSLSSVSQMSKRDHFKRKVYKCTWHFPSVLLPFLFNSTQMHFMSLAFSSGNVERRLYFPILQLADHVSSLPYQPQPCPSCTWRPPSTFQWWPTLETWRHGQQEVPGVGRNLAASPLALSKQRRPLKSYGICILFQPTSAKL